MLDDFFVRALIAGTGVAIVAGPLGSFIVWRRLAYFGDTLAHSALLGVVLAFLFEINIALAVFIVSATVALVLLYLQRRGGLASDALLGILSHATLALGLVVLALMSQMPIDLMGLLFGDILAVSKIDIAVIYGGGALVLSLLILFWKSIFAATVSTELSQAEGMKPQLANVVFMLLVAMVIAISIKIIGVLLITALLIIPAAASRQISTGPEQMAVFASIIGVGAIVSGLYGSLAFDTPSGPTIVLAAVILFALSQLPFIRKFFHR